MPSASYLIFGRKTYQQPLEWIGQLTVENGSTPKAGMAAELVEQAREQFGREGWVEMIAIPERSVVRVIPME